MTKIISKTDIISAIAYWGIRQSPYVFPKNLGNALHALNKKIDEKDIFKSKIKNEIDGYAEMTEKEITQVVKDLIFNTPEINLWNITQVEQNNGIIDPEDKARTVHYAGTSRYGSMQSPDKSFIDLHALAQNVCKMLCENE